MASWNTTKHTVVTATGSREGLVIHRAPRSPDPVQKYRTLQSGTIAEQRGGVINLPLTIPVRDGWNIIGAASVPVDVARITVTGATLATPFYDSATGLNAVTCLDPGRGYWVKFTGNGSITLNADS